MSLRYKIGAGLWLFSLQYYVVQVFVAARWQGNAAFSWSNNTISDLGNTVCGPYGERFVCSPQHDLMNISFGVLGLGMILGSMLLGRYARGRVSRAGFVCMILAGIGTILVGLFPENTVAALHVVGAALPFVLGNIGIVLLGGTLPQLDSWHRTVSAILGTVGLLATVLFVTGITLVLGVGGMERVAAYPQSIWMILVGIVLLRSKN